MGAGTLLRVLMLSRGGRVAGVLGVIPDLGNMISTIGCAVKFRVE